MTRDQWSKRLNRLLQERLAAASRANQEAVLARQPPIALSAHTQEVMHRLARLAFPDQQQERGTSNETR